MRFNYWYVFLFFVLIAMIGVLLFPSSFDMVTIYTNSYLYDRALGLLDGMERRDPDDGRIVEKRAEVVFLSGHYQEAVEILKKLVSRNPGYAETWRQLAHIHINLLEFREAMKAYEGLVKLVPGDSEALHRLAEYYRMYQLKDKAIQNLENLVKYFPKERTNRSDLAKLYVSRGKIEDCIRALIENVNLFPDDEDAVLLLTGILSYLNRREELVELYSMLLERNPDDPALLLKLAEQYEAQKQYSKADEIYESLSSSHPEDAQLLSLIGQQILAYGRKLQAKEYFMKTFERSKFDRKALEGMIYVTLEHNPKQTRGYLAQLEKQNPDDPDVVYLLATIYESLSQPEKSIALYKQYLELADTQSVDYYILREIAHAYHLTGLSQEALRVLSRTRNLFPDDIELVNDHAEILIDLKRYDEALTLLNKIKKE